MDPRCEDDVRQHAGEPVVPLPRFDAKALFAASSEIVIVHAGREYRLRITRNGKLILTA